LFNSNRNVKKTKRGCSFVKSDFSIMTKRIKRQIVIVSVFVLGLFLWRSITEFTHSGTEKLMTSFVFDESVFPSAWYFSYMRTFNIKELEERQKMKGGLLDTVLAIKLGVIDKKTENRLYELLDMLSYKGLEFDSLAEKKCLVVSVLIVTKDIRAFVYFGEKLESLSDVSRRSCKNAINKQLEKKRNSLTVNYIEKIEKVLNSLERLELDIVTGKTKKEGSKL